MGQHTSQGRETRTLFSFVAMQVCLMFMGPISADISEMKVEVPDSSIGVAAIVECLNLSDIGPDQVKIICKGVVLDHRYTLAACRWVQGHRLPALLLVPATASAPPIVFGFLHLRNCRRSSRRHRCSRSRGNASSPSIHHARRAVPDVPAPRLHPLPRRRRCALLDRGGV